MQNKTGAKCKSNPQQSISFKKLRKGLSVSSSYQSKTSQKQWIQRREPGTLELPRECQERGKLLQKIKEISIQLSETYLMLNNLQQKGPISGSDEIKRINLLFATIRLQKERSETSAKLPSACKKDPHQQEKVKEYIQEIMVEVQNIKKKGKPPQLSAARQRQKLWM